MIAMKQRRSDSDTGWVAIATDAHSMRAVHIDRDAARRPVLQWAYTAPWTNTVAGLRALRRAHPVRGKKTVAVLRHADYQLVTLEAPDVPRADWRDAVRWRLKGIVDFAVETADIEVIEIPPNPRAGSATSVFVVTAPHSTVQALADAGFDAGTPLHAVDVSEIALRNIALLGAQGSRGEALLYVGDDYCKLVVTAQDELLMSRHIDATLGQLTDADETLRDQSHERVSLELQRTFDNIERHFGHYEIVRLQVAAALPLPGFLEHVRGLLYLPVVAFDLAPLLDLSAVPALQDPKAQAGYLSVIGAALR